MSNLRLDDVREQLRHAGCHVYLTDVTLASLLSGLDLSVSSLHDDDDDVADADASIAGSVLFHQEAESDAWDDTGSVASTSVITPSSDAAATLATAAKVALRRIMFVQPVVNGPPTETKPTEKKPQKRKTKKASTKKRLTLNGSPASSSSSSSLSGTSSPSSSASRITPTTIASTSSSSAIRPPPFLQQPSISAEACKLTPTNACTTSNAYLDLGHLDGGHLRWSVARPHPRRRRGGGSGKTAAGGERRRRARSNGRRARRVERAKNEASEEETKVANDAALKHANYMVERAAGAVEAVGAVEATEVGRQQAKERGDDALLLDEVRAAVYGEGGPYYTYEAAGSEEQADWLATLPGDRNEESFDLNDDDFDISRLDDHDDVTGEGGDPRSSAPIAHWLQAECKTHGRRSTTNTCARRSSRKLSPRQQRRSPLNNPSASPTSVMSDLTAEERVCRFRTRQEAFVKGVAGRPTKGFKEGRCHKHDPVRARAEAAARWAKQCKQAKQASKRKHSSPSSAASSRGGGGLLTTREKLRREVERYARPGDKLFVSATGPQFTF